MSEPEMCECGHDEGMHVDSDAQCFDIECGCREFEPKATV
jgi:hypothetical protein